MNNEQFERLTRVGAGTPMGTFMRRYWHPIATSAQVAAPDGAPLVTWLLGERFVVFRDTEGKVGVLDDHCMHRGVSLGLGRVEEGGIRCIYHGWKFARDGRILETPNHDSCAFRERKKARAFPVRESSGLIWTYIGPADQEPPFRTFDFDQVPDGNKSVFRGNAAAPYLVLWEGGVDSSHVGMLHTNDARPSWGAKLRGEDVGPSAWDSLAPTYEVERTPYGYRYVAFRGIPGNPDARHARQVPAILPNMRIIPGHADFAIAIFEVPMDDKRTATYQMAYSHSQPIDREWAARFLGFVPPVYDEKTCNVNVSWPDNMQQDRSIMDRSWSGLPAIEVEDVAMAVSLTEPWDRSTENLVAADIAVVTLRQTLLDALKRFEAGENPPALHVEDMSAAQSYDQVVRNSEDWKAVPARLAGALQYEKA
ncbi:Rieske 2Fe-2S domain-containing protein [Sphingobium sp. LB126]|uniref:Rieske 2Fe-2S domain-containing protein n=1 Tax=Sphingobium sp. LB126 TaxID=1983755 RepID=UPI0012FE04E4|nr:Rieske 2Fe-2S domain-containing protein [Sphingobium sp. LB126]